MFVLPSSLSRSQVYLHLSAALRPTAALRPSAARRSVLPSFQRRLHGRGDGAMADSPSLSSMDFEVFGKVQGVFFRKYTRQEAMRLSLVGWVRNTERHTVEGCVQGPPDNIEQMKVWLSSKGSPKSRITRAEFSSERTLEKAEYSDFRVVK